MLAELTEKLNSMNARRTAYQDAQTQRQQAAAIQVNAQATALRNADQAFAAQQFHEQLPPPHINPQTGKLTYFFPTKDGFAPMPEATGDGSAPNHRLAMGTGSPVGPPAQQQGGEQVPPRIQEPLPPNARVQRITNGPYVTEVARDEQGRMIGFRGDIRGTGILPPRFEQAGIDPHEYVQAWQEADSAIGGPQTAERFGRVQEEFRQRIFAIDRANEASPDRLSSRELAANQQLAATFARPGSRGFVEAVNRLNHSTLAAKRTDFIQREINARDERRQASIDERQQKRLDAKEGESARRQERNRLMDHFDRQVRNDWKGPIADGDKSEDDVDAEVQRRVERRLGLLNNPAGGGKETLFPWLPPVGDEGGAAPQRPQGAMPQSQQRPPAQPGMQPNAPMPSPADSGAANPQQPNGVASLRALQQQAWQAQDADAINATTLLAAAIERYGHISRVPENQRQELMEMKKAVDAFRNRNRK